jgi:hypothetical protein
MPYAADGKIAVDDFDGSIEITEAQYAEALEGMLNGLCVTISGGFKVAPPEPLPIPPEPELTPAEIEATAFAVLYSKQRQALAQISAIQSRVDALNYLINDQDPDDPDYLEPTGAEIAELPVRKAQLKLWNSYRAKLGRVTGLAGWYQTPAWPVIPEPYTSEMSAEVPLAS